MNRFPGRYFVLFFSPLILLCAFQLGSYDLSDYLWTYLKLKHSDAFPKTALVLGGGGARGLAHLGVLKVWEENGFPLDCITGTSSGALVGGLYSSGLSLKEIEELSRDLDWDDLVSVKYSLPRIISMKYVISSDKMERYLDKKIGNKRFHELKIPFACVAADLNTGEKIVFREGELGPALRASSSIPGIFEPVYYRHRLLVDGGILEKIPLEAAFLLGAEFTVAVDVGGTQYNEEFDNIINILGQVITIQSSLLTKKNMDAADVLIEPDLSDVKPSDLKQWEKARNRGIYAAYLKTPAIKEKLILKSLERLKKEK